MKRFYEAVSLVQVKNGYKLFLDTREVKTPLSGDLILPNKRVGGLTVGEWQSQADKIDPSTMPVTQLVYTAIDRVAPRRDEIVEELMRFGGTDLVCYRAEGPDALKSKQYAVWDPYIKFAAISLGAELKLTHGIMHTRQPAAAIIALRQTVSSFDSMALAALYQLVNGFGSLVLALALVRGFKDFDKVWQASQLDESFQAEAWGEDNEAALVREALRCDLKKTYDFFIAL